MKLGRALATGVAQERPATDEAELELPSEIMDLTESTPEEVPVAR